MIVTRTVAELRLKIARHRGAGETIGLVPTMGAFHEGHLSLMRRARERCDRVVVSLFVNPTQFAPGEDLGAYPRAEERDAALAEAAGVDLLFVPPVEEVYPAGARTTVAVSGLTAPLEGERRGAAHFDGVTTVVAKLFNMASPDVAFFGQKDAQQVVVIRRMARDLDFPVEIETCPTVREPDGLALSSRNAYLQPDERERALSLSRALLAAEESIAAGETDPAAVATTARAVMAAHGVEPEYLEIVHPATLVPVAAIDDEVLVAIAATVGRARLIDNSIVRAAARTSLQGRQAIECNA
jgi:pantoate--beta-alanine ligase